MAVAALHLVKILACCNPVLIVDFAEFRRNKGCVLQIAILVEIRHI
jgi:Ni,Fe-hydrogenase maturation factor